MDKLCCGQTAAASEAALLPEAGNDWQRSREGALWRPCQVSTPALFSCLMFSIWWHINWPVKLVGNILLMKCAVHG